MHIFRRLLIIVFLLIFEKYWSTISKYIWMYTCAEMTSSEIANLKLVVDAKNVKIVCTIKRLCKQRWSTIPPISKTRTMTSHSAAIVIWLFTELKSLNLSKNCLLSLAKQFYFLILMCWKGNLAMQVGKLFFNWYSYYLLFVYAFSVWNFHSFLFFLNLGNSNFSLGNTILLLIILTLFLPIPSWFLVLTTLILVIPTLFLVIPTLVLVIQQYLW